MERRSTDSFNVPTPKPVPYLRFIFAEVQPSSWSLTSSRTACLAQLRGDRVPPAMRDLPPIRDELPRNRDSTSPRCAHAAVGVSPQGGKSRPFCEARYSREPASI